MKSDFNDIWGWAKAATPARLWQVSGDDTAHCPPDDDPRVNEGKLLLTTRDGEDELSGLFHETAHAELAVRGAVLGRFLSFIGSEIYGFNYLGYLLRRTEFYRDPDDVDEELDPYIAEFHLSAGDIANVVRYILVTVSNAGKLRKEFRIYHWFYAALDFLRGMRQSRMERELLCNEDNRSFETSSCPEAAAGAYLLWAAGNQLQIAPAVSKQLSPASRVFTRHDLAQTVQLVVYQLASSGSFQEGVDILSVVAPFYALLHLTVWVPKSAGEAYENLTCWLTGTQGGRDFKQITDVKLCSFERIYMADRKKEE